MFHVDQLVVSSNRTMTATEVYTKKRREDENTWSSIR